MSSSSGGIHFVKTTIVGGLLFLVPVVVLAFVLDEAIELMSIIVEPLAEWVPVETVAGFAMANILAIAGLVVVCFAAGLVARAGFLKKRIDTIEKKVLSKLPGYVLIKGMLSGLEGDDANRLFPVLATVANTGRVGLEIERIEDGRVVVLIPSSPNPWSGQVHIIGGPDVQRLDLPMVGYMEFVERFGQGADHLVRIRDEPVRRGSV